MKLKKRENSDIFGLSFMDCICCGFGAVILMFILTTGENAKQSEEIKNKLEATVQKTEDKLRKETQKFQSLISEVAELEKTLQSLNQQAKKSEQAKEEASENLATAIENKSEQSKTLQSLLEQEQKLKKQLIQIEAEVNQLSNQPKGSTGKAVIPFGEDERRQYLTGLKVDGDRIALLVDISYSMLSETISGLNEYNNITDPNKLISRKWTRVLDTVDWLMANMECDYYQIILYNEKASFALSDTARKWMLAKDVTLAEKTSYAVWNTIPTGGSNLEAAFKLASTLSPKPDNIFLITDALPTHSSAHATGLQVTGKERKTHFRSGYKLAKKHRFPINVILYPFEGDPYAAGSYWKLADQTKGSLFTPSPNWPN